MAKSNSGRRWEVDAHPERERIIQALIKGDRSFRSIAKQFGLSAAAITRYMHGKLTVQASAVLTEDADKNGRALLQRVEKIVRRMQKLYDACDEYLQHPEDPEKYELGPKAWEIDVTYRAPDPRNRTKTIAGHDTLNNLLERLETRKIKPVSIRFRFSDPRKLIIETAGVLSKQLELIGRIQGQVQVFGGDTVVNVLVVNQKGEINGHPNTDH